MSGKGHSEEGLEGVIPPYDLDLLKEKARTRLREKGEVVTSLEVYRFVALIRREELQAAARQRKVSKGEGRVKQSADHEDGKGVEGAGRHHREVRHGGACEME